MVKGENTLSVSLLEAIHKSNSYKYSIYKCVCIFMWTEIFFKKERETVYKNTRGRVGMALVTSGLVQMKVCRL